MLDARIDNSALHFLDFGSVYSPDGREHPVTGQTPVYPVQLPGVLAGSTQTPATPGTPMQQAGLQDFIDLFTGRKHVGARLIAATIAVGLILIVAFRITR